MRAICDLVRKNRMRDYFEILQFARDSGYLMQSLSAAYAPVTTGKEFKLIILRHDVDHQSVATEEMAQLEHEVGATSSFYFRWSTMDVSLMKRLMALGHECSFHFETISDYYKTWRLNPRKQPLTEEILDACRHLLVEEVSRFERRCADAGLDLKVRTIAAHGDRVNRLLGVPNNWLTKCRPPDFLRDIGEAYDPAFIENLDAYISDSPLRHNGGYAYADTPMKAIAAVKNRILFLTHPEHWRMTRLQLFKAFGTAALLGTSSRVSTFRY